MKNQLLFTTACILIFSTLPLNNAESNELVIDKMAIVAEDAPMGQGASGTSESLLPEDNFLPEDEDLFGTRWGGGISILS